MSEEMTQEEFDAWLDEVDEEEAMQQEVMNSYITIMSMYKMETTLNIKKSCILKYYYTEQ